MQKIDTASRSKKNYFFPAAIACVLFTTSHSSCCDWVFWMASCVVDVLSVMHPFSLVVLSLVHLHIDVCVEAVYGILFYQTRLVAVAPYNQRTGSTPHHLFALPVATQKVRTSCARHRQCGVAYFVANFSLLILELWQMGHPRLERRVGLDNLTLSFSCQG